ncbi:hypothetical protein GCK72_006969 [Caenorhabditis remanei]|uniref:Uncharacterized protein n=1 Tax=Caenorhabditis remanei TaxID=31234 RepID=A0A6A5HIQ6_CAERE|nr:hypothetical protein GCK72_006969 [Caenorhabditis remanei]KAF1767011.1 hypothetical protein GCK72_006969 [Caenorhabditis remanei]
MTDREKILEVKLNVEEMKRENAERRAVELEMRLRQSNADNIQRTMEFNAHVAQLQKQLHDAEQAASRTLGDKEREIANLLRQLDRTRQQHEIASIDHQVEILRLERNLLAATRGAHNGTSDCNNG